MTTTRHCDRCGGYSGHLVHTGKDLLCPVCLATTVEYKWDMAPSEGLSDVEIRIITMYALSAIFTAFWLGFLVAWFLH
ncbi:MAG: hypothetical protein ACP5I8_15840 [Phycisphaerae bacterium]